MLNTKIQENHRTEHAVIPKQRDEETLISNNDNNNNAFPVFTGLQTYTARLMLWLNLPSCYLILLATLTGHLEAWRQSLPPSQQRAVSYFAGFFGAWLFISHLYGIPGAWLWELWWNPFARMPALKGKVDRAEMQRTAEENRAIARGVLKYVFG